MAGRKSFLLRVDAAVLEAMQRWANDDLRSLNGQIEYVLRDAVRRAGRSIPPAAPTPLDALQRWADDDLRSLNGQIEFVLRRTLQETGRLKPGDGRKLRNSGT